VSRRRKPWLVAFAAGLAALLVWVVAPVDLIPSWASGGSVGEMKSTVTGTNALGGTTTTIIDYSLPEGFARGLTGMRLTEAKQQVSDLRGTAYRVVSNNFVGQPADASRNISRVNFTVVLGRVVRTTVG